MPSSDIERRQQPFGLRPTLAILAGVLLGIALAIAAGTLGASLIGIAAGDFDAARDFLMPILLTFLLLPFGILYGGRLGRDYAARPSTTVWVGDRSVLVIAEHHLLSWVGGVLAALFSGALMLLPAMTLLLPITRQDRFGVYVASILLTVTLMFLWMARIGRWVVRQLDREILESRRTSVEPQHD